MPLWRSTTPGWRGTETIRSHGPRRRAAGAALQERKTPVFAAGEGLAPLPAAGTISGNDAGRIRSMIRIRPVFFCLSPSSRRSDEPAQGGAPSPCRGPRARGGTTAYGAMPSSRRRTRIPAKNNGAIRGSLPTRETPVCTVGALHEAPAVPMRWTILTGSS